MHFKLFPAFIHKLDRQSIHIYWIPISLYKNYFLNFSHGDEINFINHHINNLMRQTQFLAVRSLLRYLCLEKNSIQLGEIKSDVSGVPILNYEDRKLPINISFSHNKQFVGLALCENKPVGFDIESSERDFLKIKDKFISKKEYEYLQKIQKNQNILSPNIQTILGIVFSFKESVFKAIFPTHKKSFYFEHCVIDSICMETKQILAKVDPIASGYSPGIIEGYFFLNQEDSLIFTWLELKPS